MDVKIAIVIQLEATTHHVIHIQENVIVNQALLAKSVISVLWHTMDFHQKDVNLATAIRVVLKVHNAINSDNVLATITSKEDVVTVVKKTSLIVIKAVWIVLLVIISFRKQQMNIEENWQT
uniref:(northern house mosquito) hypothetical protein n=1 Tax=Culex pipiens TaxID=7175 RepID=A0A8D8JS41_CULPI